MLTSASSVTSTSGISLPHRSAPVASCGSVTSSGFPHHHQHRNSLGAIGSRSRMAVITATSVLDRTTTMSPPMTDSLPAPEHTFNQLVREGHYESELVALQAGKRDKEQPSIAGVLPAADSTRLADVVVVGAGPSGLCLAAELAKRGLNVVIVGHDRPIVNNYGVWLDEFEALGLLHTLDCSWPDAVCYFGEGKEVRVGRGYGRVSRRKLREHLLQQCLEAGVSFHLGEVEGVEVVENGRKNEVKTCDGTIFKSRLVTLAAGAAAGKFLSYEEDAPVVASQTAYGIEAEVEGYDAAYPGGLMLFMDFRRHHTGMYEGTGSEMQISTPLVLRLLSQHFKKHRSPADIARVWRT